VPDHLHNDVEMLRIAGRWYVYVDEEHIAAIADLIDFSKAHSKEFHRFRQTWGAMQATRH
jgi:hypothetical protein